MDSKPGPIRVEFMVRPEIYGLMVPQLKGTTQLYRLSFRNNPRTGNVKFSYNWDSQEFVQNVTTMSHPYVSLAQRMHCSLDLISPPHVHYPPLPYMVIIL